MKTIDCTSRDIAVRGRNGYFDLKEVEVSELESGNIYIGLFSKKRGQSAPVSFYGSREDLYGVFAEICHFVSSPT